MQKHKIQGADFLSTQIQRSQRLSEILERQISPEGTYPLFGRSISSARFGVFHSLSQCVLLGQLPDTLKAGQVRAALTAVINRQFKNPDNFDEKHWLRIGFAGHQPELAENYVSTGSLYLCTTIFLPLGLPCQHPFWTEPALPWTGLNAWNGRPVLRDIAKDSLHGCLKFSTESSGLTWQLIKKIQTKGYFFPILLVSWLLSVILFFQLGKSFNRISPRFYSLTPQAPKLRDSYIDILRGVGLMLIIMAHTMPHGILFQLRNFDVPLMVFISGLSFADKEIKNYTIFLWKRTLRLYVPVCIFLTCFFISIYCLHRTGIIGKQLTWGTILQSFLLYKGIGYVWIIRVFLLIMLFTPLFLYVNHLVKKQVVFIIFLCLILAVNIAIGYLSYPSSLKGVIIQKVVEEYISYLLGYSVIFFLGLRLRFAKTIEIIGYAAFFLVLIGVLFIENFLVYGTIPNLQLLKYPPKLIFLVNGAAISIFLWCFHNHVHQNKLTKGLMLIGKNTIWIYLWHIATLSMVEPFVHSFALKYVLVFFSSVIITLLQAKFADSKIGQKLLPDFLRSYLK